jgi:hypothetical protein
MEASQKKECKAKSEATEESKRFDNTRFGQRQTFAHLERAPGWPALYEAQDNQFGSGVTVDFRRFDATRFGGCYDYTEFAHVAREPSLHDGNRAAISVSIPEMGRTVGTAEVWQAALTQSGLGAPEHSCARCSMGSLPQSPGEWHELCDFAGSCFRTVLSSQGAYGSLEGPVSVSAQRLEPTTGREVDQGYGETVELSAKIGESTSPILPHSELSDPQ